MTSARGEKGKAMRPKDLVFTSYPTPRSIDEIATRATNQGIYTVDSEIKTVHYFLEDGYMVIGTPNGHLRLSIDRAEAIAWELIDIIPEYRKDIREGRRLMTSKEIGKMLESDYR